jgi:hypothetical protein
MDGVKGKTRVPHESGEASHQYGIWPQRFYGVHQVREPLAIGIPAGTPWVCGLSNNLPAIRSRPGT